MSSPLAVLQPRHLYGLRGDIKDNAQYSEDGSLIYVGGHNVILYQPDTKTQRFLPSSNDSERITAVAISPNKKLLAIAERADKAVIAVYDLQSLKRRKVLTSSETLSKEYVSLAFSPDSKVLVAQGGAPDWNLTVWVWEKSKIVASTRTTNQNGNAIHQVSFSAGENGLISVVGQNIFKVFKTGDSALRPLPSPFVKKDPQNCPCSVWLPDGQGDRERLLLGTDTGEVVLVEGSDIKSTFSCDNGLSVESIALYSKGWVAGQDNGVITLFEKDEKEMFRRARSFTIQGNPHKIKSLAISPNEENLVCGLENGQMYTLSLANTEIMKVDEMNFEVLGTTNHSQSITGMDVCVRKPLVATCSADHTIRIWNYMDRSVELCKTFPEEPCSVALHPSGFTMLAGFADKLRLLTVLMDDLRVVKEVSIKGCRECCFSNGGQYFAAVNGTTISIYSTHTAENLCNLRAHSGKVRSVHWSADDSKVVTAGMDGAIYEWRLKDCKREKEAVLKGCGYTCVLGTPDGKDVLAVGSDKKLKELQESPGSGTQVSKEYDTGVVLTQICLPSTSKVLFAAAETGALRCYKYPLTGEYHEVKHQAGAITRLRVSHDEALLFASSEDGTLMALDIKDKDTAKQLAKREQEKLPWAEEVLITKSELDEKKARTAELEQMVTELTMQGEYKLRLKDLHMQERIKELNDKFSAELEADKAKFDMLLQEKSELEVEYEEKLKQAEERSNAQLSALDSQYQAKIMAEVERYQQLLAEKELLAQRWDEQNSLLVESHERVIAELTEEYETRLADEAARTEALAAEKQQVMREFDEIKKQLEEDADREIEELKEKYEQKLQAERNQLLQLKGENAIMRKKFTTLHKDIDAQKEEIKRLFDQKKELYGTISGLEKDIASLRREIRERDDTIGDKERRIYDLKKKNQELEKFKFVLDFKIKELKKQIEPREEEIERMKEQIMEMDGELERYHKTNSNLDLEIGNLKMRQDGLQSEVLGQRMRKADALAMYQRVQYDLQEIIQHFDDPKSLKDKVKVLYQRHCTMELPIQAVEENVQREYNRQRDYLERAVEVLKKKLSRDSELHRTDNLRIMQENVALIKEINELRRELKATKASSGASTGSKSMTRSTGRTDDAADDGKELDMQRELISRLRDDLQSKESRIKQLESMVIPRPMSREKLPPMDGFQTTA